MTIPKAAKPVHMIALPVMAQKTVYLVMKLMTTENYSTKLDAACLWPATMMIKAQAMVEGKFFNASQW